MARLCRALESMGRIFIFIVIFILGCYGRGMRKVNVAAGWKVDGGRNSLIGSGLGRVDVGGDGEEWLAGFESQERSRR